VALHLDQNGDFASEREVRKFDYRCCEYCRDSGIHRVATLLQDTKTCLNGERMTARYYTAPSSDNRAKRIGVGSWEEYGRK
jgi:hypothetical protein